MAAARNNQSKSNTSRGGGKTGQKAAAKGSTKTKKNTSGKNQIPEDTASMGEEIILLIFVAISVLLEFSNFGVFGVIGDFLSRIMFGLFCFIAYI
ncbi:MAG: hypothetical protein K2G89_00975, partial [Lachnospiraceae bacterium]|nr:hypothetical protein [Lachnospiraceae bacterium]